MKKILLAIIVALVGAGQSMAKDYTNPVYNGGAADPTVIRAQDGAFYAYATGGVVLKSTDLVTWRKQSRAFTSMPNWIEGGGGALWAPDINYINGQYVMYYAQSKWGEEWKNGIGVAVSNTPGGPFRDLGCMFTSTEIGVQNSIDPDYVEANGKKYLFWGSFSGIYYVELSDDAMSVKTNASPVRIGGNAFEAAYIHKRGEYYYMFCSIGTCCEGANSTYKTVVGRSKSVTGPYVDRNGNSMLYDYFEVVIGGNGRWAGPGHNGDIITDDEGRDWIPYHGWDILDEGPGRKMFLDEVIWVDGWPVVKGKTASYTTQDGPTFYDK
jgi:arabinan endo-1,5-alpha-L-arabinosidase